MHVLQAAERLGQLRADGRFIETAAGQRVGLATSDEVARALVLLANFAVTLAEERFGKPVAAHMAGAEGAKTLAERFVSDPGAMAYESPYLARDTGCYPDGAAEIVLADGSVAHCIPTDPEPWKVGLLPSDKKAGG